ncbi:hypothetical protein EDEG_01292 [Edhazardia aedis USNM 41457]|uniref:Ribosomal protein L21e n=1 Tax=Edhazardia aedis (strain USNM 41457) TaxID=1003232 RepID=J9DPJ4_EDHAE|nr:hypothetical protein EDEG_01292 [Edhazardia aedis USNM 41457]|eukprot:EJW04475.1 hypothetical protein EDEG_01292 [Edhazardia aedis USNM 41457]
MKRNGFCRNTRKKFKKDLRKKGVPNITSLLQVYKNNDYVDIKINSAYNKSMPHKIYHGRTGKVYKVDERTIGVKVKRVSGNREYEDKIDVRKEHLRLSKCRDDFLKRSRAYFEEKKKCESEGLPLPDPKRKQVGGRKAVTISLVNNNPIKVGFEKHFDIF